MFCKQLLALFLWCHCYQNILNPLLRLVVGVEESLLLVSGTSITVDKSIYKRHSNEFYDGDAPINVENKQVALTPGHEIALKCYITEYPNEQFSWYRIRKYPSKAMQSPGQDGRLGAREDLKANHDDKLIISNNVIKLKSPTFADIGDYYCVVNNDKVESREAMIHVRAKPYIQEFDLESSTFKSAVVEEGKSLKLSCNVIDDYEPNITISWHMSRFEEDDMNVVTSGEDGIKIEEYNDTSQALIIDRVTKDHRRFYKCRASNHIVDNSKVILIRVRDKYTFLWPTVGIVIELVILIGVICVVENRKVEPDKDTYDRKAIQM